MILKDWTVFVHNSNEYQAPELGSPRLQGEVYGHPRFVDGTFVHTSTLISIEDMGTHKEAKTMGGSTYILYKENLSKECEKQYPNYYEKLILK